MHLPAFLPDHPAHFEQIGEIGREIDSETQAARLKIEIADAEPFEATSLPQEARAANVYEVVLHDNPAIVNQAGVGEVASQRGVIVAQRRTQHDWATVIHCDQEMRQMASVAIIDALRSARRRKHIALGVEHAKSVAMFEYERLQFRERGGGGNDKRVTFAGLLPRRLSVGRRNALPSFLLNIHRSIRIQEWDATSRSHTFQTQADEFRPQSRSN